MEPYRTLVDTFTLNNRETILKESDLTGPALPWRDALGRGRAAARCRAPARDFRFQALFRG